MKEAIERRNKEQLLKSCFKTENGVAKKKTKTADIVDVLESEDYKRKPMDDILNFDRTSTKVIILARFCLVFTPKKKGG